MEFSIIKLESNQSNVKKMIDVVTLLNNEYPIPLTEKIDIKKYVEKVFTMGNILIAERESEILGFVTFYSNNFEMREGAFSLLGILPSYRRFGIANLLFQESFKIMRSQGMLTAYSFTHKENIKGLSFHLNLGFEIIDKRIGNQDYNISLLKKL